MIAAAVGIVTLLFPGLLKGLASTDGFMPHATCYLRNSKVIFLHVSSDLTIGLSYVAISLLLGYLVYKASKHIPFHWMFLAFGLFIVTCGFTHFMEVWTVWQPVYWLAGYVKFICAAASLATAIALARLVPRIFELIEGMKVSEERRLKLETANADLEAFAYSVSHDLRAPLRAVSGMAGALRQDYGEKLGPEGHMYIDRINAASGKMDALIRDLLEYSRVSRAVVTPEPLDPRDVIDEAKAAISVDLENAHAEVQVAGTFPKVLANRTLLTQALMNLLSNAIKFVQPGVRPIVRVYARESMGAVRIAIQDNGIGIPREYQGKIFGIFERLHPANEYPGTGIGLAIVQKAIDRMHGALGLESEPGSGSLFWIELPKAS
jgi:signal transduction histidine kinase